MNRTTWKILEAIVLFLTAGLIFARDFFRQLGLDVGSPVIITVALMVTTMMLYRSIISVVAMVIFVLFVNQPDEALEAMNMDRDVLLACAITILFMPWLRTFAEK